MLLQNLTAIPQSRNTLDNFETLSSAINTLSEYTRNNSVRCRTCRNDDLGYIIKLAHKINLINCIFNKDWKAITWDWQNKGDTLILAANGDTCQEKTMGIMINEEPRTHFDETQFKRIKRMPILEDILKQSPNHFLRVFTSELNSILYVWSNKPLEPITIYKLMQLENKLVNDKLNNPVKYVTDFYDGLVNSDVEAVKTAVNAFMESDFVKEFAVQRFKDCVRYNITNKINRLERDLTDYRTSITTYENEILELATKIRTVNETIETLKNKDQDEDINRLYKYLSKHPYIYKFQAHEEGTIDFYYHAPLLYYNEYALDKLIKSKIGVDRRILTLIKERKYTLWCRCAIRFNTSTFRIHTIDSEWDNYFPHPHIVRFGCFGNHNTAISESAISGDFLGAIEQISQAVLNINFYDGCVINAMLRDLMQDPDKKTWVSEETGEMFTTNELVLGETV